MRNEADCLGHRNDRTTTNICASGGWDSGDSDECGRDALTVSRGLASGEAQDGAAPSDIAHIPEGVRVCAEPKPGEYDARRLRSQREIIRDVMLSAASCETWLTLGELRALTRYGEASISAQLRHLRKAENGGYDVTKRHREGVRLDGRPALDGRGECVWEYRMTSGMCVGRAGSEADLAAVGA